MTDCEHRRVDLGAYALGGLSVDETAAAEAHLAECAACRAEHAELVGAVELLAAADEAPPQVPARVRDRVVAATARRGARRRWAAAVAGAAAVAALLGAVAGWQFAPAAPSPVAVPLQEVEPFEASGWATFAHGDDGVVVSLELDGLEPLDDPGVYEAWLSTGDDGIVSIGQLEVGDESVAAELPASGSLDDYRYLWVTAEPDGGDPAHEGPTVVRAPVPEPR